MATSIFAVLIALGLVLVPAPSAVAAVGIYKTINFQGKVTNANGTNVVNGTYSFTFSLYTVASVGTNIWTETKSLTVTDGVFQTNLGSVTSLPGSVDFNTDNIFLGMNFNSDGEMSPRIQFTASAYAFNSDKLQGLSAAAFAQLNPASAQSGSLNVTGSVQAATSLQAPLVDTATAAALSIGTATATSLTLGRTTTPFLMQGNSSSTFSATSGVNTTTVSFAAPTAARSIVFPDAGGTLCTTTATTCSATYQAASTTGYILKNAQDTSSASTLGSLLGLTNTNAGAAGVLSLSNAGTNSTLSVSQTGNPTAGQALILVNNTNGTPSGNLIDLQVAGTSKLAIDISGNVTQTGAAATTATINGQRISAAANFTGTVTAATSLLAPLLATTDVVTGTSAGIIVRSGNGTAGGAGSGNVTIDAGSKNTAGLTGNVNIATTNASALTLGRSGLQPSFPGGFTANGPVLIQPATDSTSIFNIKSSATGTNGNEFTVDTVNGRVGINLGASLPTLTGSGLEIAGALRLSGGFGALMADSFTTPVGSSVSTKINVPLFDPGNFGQIVALGLPASASSSARVLSALDARTVAHQPTLAVFSPDENNIVGFSWEGSNTSTYLKTTGGNLIVRSGTTDLITALSGGNVGIGLSPGYKLDVAGDANISSGSVYRINGTQICASTGCTPASGSTNYIQNGTLQQASSNFNISGTGTAATSILAPLIATVDVASGTSAGVTLRSGNGTVGGAGSGNVTIDTGSKNGVGLAGNVNIGTTNTANVTIGRNSATATGTTISLQGLAATSSFIFNDAGNTNATTISFVNPTAARSVVFSDAGGTVCTTSASTCSATYQAAGSFLLKNASDTSTASFAGNLLTLSNTNAGAAGILSLANSGTSAALAVSASANPTAGQAVILATNTNGIPTGNLIDLRVTAGSKFSVDTAGVVVTGSTINGQTISSAASFTGSVTAATGVTVTTGGINVTGTATFNNAVSITGLTTTTGGITNNGAGIAATGAITGATTITASSIIVGGGAFKSADSTTTAVTSLKSGNASAGNSGAVSLDSGTATGTAGAVTIGGTSAPSVTIGRNAPTATSTAILLQGLASSSSFVFNNAANTFATTIGFTTPTAANSIVFPDASGTVCTTVVSTCSATYNAAGSFLQKNVNDTSAASFLGNLYSFTNSNSGGAGVLSLINSGSSAALSVSASSNATAGQALILATNTNVTPSGNLIDLRVTAGSRFSVDTTGAVTTSSTINGQTISAAASFTGSVTSATGISVTAGGITVGGNSNITGTLGVSSTLTVSANGASITGGINNNAGGITGAGAVSGLSSLQYNTNGTLDTSAANSITIGGTNANAITIGKSTATQPTVSLQGGTGSAFTITSGANSTSLAFSALSAGGKTVSIPNETGTICTSAVSSNSNCTNYAPSTLGTGYIQNQIAGQQSASNFWISSVGRSDGSFLTPTLDTPSAVALNIGTSGSPTTTAINLNQNTTIATGKSLTANGAITQSGGAFSLAGNGPSSLSTTAGNALTITSAAAATWSTGAGALTVQGFGGTNITTPAAAGAVTSTISVATGNVTSGAFASGSITVDTGISTGTTGTITIGGTSTSAVNLGHVGISVVNAGTEQLGISAGTGALVNNGTTVNTSYPMANLISGGWDVGGAAATVDKYTYISANQISTGQTLTVPNPTAATSYGRILYISNIGTASFSLLSTTIGPGSTATLIWANANGGAAWTFAGADSSGILNQSTSDQTANFRISGTGRANTSVTTPLLDSITGGLSIGTGTATGITLGGAATTGVIGIGTAAASTLNIGTGAFAHTIAIGTDASTVQGLTIGSTNASSVTTLQAGSAINLNSATVATNQATISLFNAAASTVNEFGAATAINVGGANAVVTYGNGSAATLRTTTGALTVTSAAAATWSTGVGALSIDSAAALNLGITNATAVSIGKTTTTTNISGTTQIGTLNTAGTGALVNNGITKNATFAIGDLNYIGTGNTGALGTAAATVDIYTAFTVNQATAGQTITIPTPTVGVAASTGRIIYISNIGATSFTLLVGGATMNGSSTATLVFNGTVWTFAGADGNGILNQSAVAQAASFFINGTGKASTSLLTPLIDSISGVLSIGTGTATGITVGGSATTGTISVGNAAASTINIGTSANAHTIGIGSDPTTVQGVTLGSTSGASATTINGGSGNINLTVNQAGAGVIVKTATTASATAFQVQNTLGMALLLVDTANAGIRIGDTTNFVQYTNGTREPVLNGTARHAKNLIMTAEFAGAVLDASGTSNTGTMTAAFEPTQRFGYYKWISSQASAQNYDIVATVPVPDDFSSFTGTPTFWNYGSVGSSMAVTITDTAGTVATNYNASALTVSTTWTSRSVATPAITGTYTQGSNMIIRIKLTGAALTGDVRLGTITLPYLSRY